MKNTQTIGLSITTILLAGLLILPGCGGGDEDTTTGSDAEVLTFFRLVEATDFNIQVPEDWETIQTFPSDYPENTVVVFRNDVKDHHFIANINIVRNEVDEGTTTKDYALQTYETISSQLVNFNEISEEEVELPSGDTTVTSYIYEFEGSNNSTDESRGFIQTYGVVGTNAYIVTGTYALDDTELAVDQVRQSIPAFALN